MVKIKKDEEKIFLLLKEAVRKAAGKTSEPLVNVLFGKSNVNEFKIASQLGLTINQTRNILYKMSNHNLLNSTRKKDEKKGWYTYFWTLDFEKSLEFLLKAKIQERITFEGLYKSRETKNFYTCAIDNIEMSEETAMHHNFFCPECGQLLQIVPEDKKLKEISSKIEDINNQIKVIATELERIKPKIEEKPKSKKKEKKEKKQKIKKATNKKKGKMQKKPQKDKKKKLIKKKTVVVQKKLKKIMPTKKENKKKTKKPVKKKKKK